MESFEARALQMAFDLTIRNTYEGRVGQGYNEARAEDIRRLYNILCGRRPEEHGHLPLPGTSVQPAALQKTPAPRRKKIDLDPPVSL